MRKNLKSWCFHKMIQNDNVRSRYYYKNGMEHSFSLQVLTQKKKMKGAMLKYRCQKQKHLLARTHKHCFIFLFTIYSSSKKIKFATDIITV